MTSVQARLHESLPRRAELLEAITSTSHASPSAFAASEEYIADLEKQISHHDDHFNDIAHIRRRAQLGWKPHDSGDSFKKFTAALRGKKAEFEDKRLQEEAAWNQALEEEKKQKQARKEMAGTLENAKIAHEELEMVYRKRLHLERQLDLLYEAVFRGALPPECAAVDLAESYISPATRAMEEARKVAESETQAARILNNAQDTVNSALGSIKDALGASQGDKIPMTSDRADYHKRQALMQAENQLGQARQQVVQAQSLVPEIGTLPGVTGAHGNAMGDVAFDSWFSASAFHKKIEKMQKETRTLLSALQKEIKLADRRAAIAQGLCGEAKSELETAKEKLRQARVEAFERLATAAGVDVGTAVASVPQESGAHREPPPYKP